MSINDAEAIIRKSVDLHVRTVLRRSEFRDDLDDLLHKFDGLCRLIQSGDI